MIGTPRRGPYNRYTQAQPTIRKFPVSKIVKAHIGNNYPTPANLNINWCYGSAIVAAMLIQIISGLVLATFYVPTSAEAYKQILEVTRIVNYGNDIRYLHRTNVSRIFIFRYRHIARGLFYGSYRKQKSA